MVHLPEILHPDVGSTEVVDRHMGTEKALNLAAVEINGNDTVCSHGLQQASDVRRRDRHTSAHFTVLPRISIVRDYSGNSPAIDGHR